jgi:DNA-directed RNA polymerase subunit RPC12/RpoP
MRALCEHKASDRSTPAEAAAIIKEFNSRLAAERPAWSWPTIGAALTSKHHWLVVACYDCGTIVDTDLRVKRRAANASIWVAAQEVRCPRCGSEGGRIVRLARNFSL